MMKDDDTQRTSTRTYCKPTTFYIMMNIAGRVSLHLVDPKEGIRLGAAWEARCVGLKTGRTSVCIVSP